MSDSGDYAEILKEESTPAPDPRDLMIAVLGAIINLQHEINLLHQKFSRYPGREYRDI